MDELIGRCHVLLGDDADIQIVTMDRIDLKAKFPPVISQLTVDQEPRWTEPYQRALIS